MAHPSLVGLVGAREQTEAELAGLRRSVLRGSPYCEEAWSDTAIETLGLEITTRPFPRFKTW